MKAITTTTKRTLFAAITAGIILCFLLPEMEHSFIPGNNFNTPSKEFFNPNVEPRTESNSGTDNSNIGVSAAFMIGLPDLN